MCTKSFHCHAPSVINCCILHIGIISQLSCYTYWSSHHSIHLSCYAYTLLGTASPGTWDALALLALVLLVSSCYALLPCTSYFIAMFISFARYRFISWVVILLIILHDDLIVIVHEYVYTAVMLFVPQSVLKAFIMLEWFRFHVSKLNVRNILFVRECTHSLLTSFISNAVLCHQTWICTWKIRFNVILISGSILKINFLYTLFFIWQGTIGLSYTVFYEYNIDYIGIQLHNQPLIYILSVIESSAVFFQEWVFWGKIIWFL